MENHFKLSVQKEFIFRSTRNFFVLNTQPRYHLFQKYKHSLNYKLIYVTRTHDFVICKLFSKKNFPVCGHCNLQNFSLTFKTYSKTCFFFHICYRTLQNFNLTWEDKCFCQEFSSILGVSEDFEALFSERLEKFYMNLILMLCVFNY